MKVLLLKDVFKLGRAGDLKKVADGYARNFLLPRGFASPATAGALKQAERVRAAGDKLRDKENNEKVGESLHFHEKPCVSTGNSAAN